jgi:hypothetical protein
MAYASTNSGAFLPLGNTVTFLANTSSPTPVQPFGAINGSGFIQYRIFNSGASLVFLGYGANASVANTNAIIVSTSGNSIPVLPGTLEVLSLPSNSFFTAITSAGTSQIYITPGTGI